MDVGFSDGVTTEGNMYPLPVQDYCLFLCFHTVCIDLNLSD